MTTCELSVSGTIELYFYGELPPAERDAFASHLAGCRACREALEELVVIREALAGRPMVSGPASGDWSRFMARLDAAVGRDGAGGVVPAAAQRSRAPYPVAGYLAMAALLALVTMSVLFAIKSRGAAVPSGGLSSDPAVSSAAVKTGDPAPGDDRAFEELSEEHFERSKLVVLGLATKDADRTTSADWTYERQLATSLLSDTRMYRLAAEDRGLSRLAGVMRDLELVLLQTSLTDETDPAALPQIQRLIHRRDLIEKMDTVGGL